MISRFNDYLNRKNIEIDEVKDVILNMEDLEKQAKRMAKAHTVSKELKSTKSLLYRLDDHYEKISAIYQEVYLNNQKQYEVSPASQWLLDNFYKIEEQVKDVRQNIFKERFLKLSILEGGYLKGLPRVYAIMLKLVSHTDGRLDEDTLIRFVNAYQRRQVLTIAEIWSLSLMLRIALIERIRIICEGIEKTERAWRQAEDLIGRKTDEIEDYIKEVIDTGIGVNAPLVEHLLRILRQEEGEGFAVISYIEESLRQYNLSMKELVEDVHNQQAAAKITIGNCIISLTLVATIDWNDIFEDMSIVEAILREDPAGVYAKMDFESRDYYRKRIEKIAQQRGTSEIKVAQEVLRQSKEVEGADPNNPKLHVGYYLLQKERKSLSQYLTPIILGTVLIVALLQLYSYYYLESFDLLLSFIILSITVIPASDIVIPLVNRVYTRRYPPDFIPRLAYRDGIPQEVATMVVVPTLVTDQDRVKDLLQQLEVYYLANREENIYFSIAGDFKDSTEEESPTDEGIIAFAMKEVKKLNKKYAKEGPIFYYFHRQRQYSKTQGKWMGWERKRGALDEFNRLLLGDKKTSYSFVSGDISHLKEIKYVITLDADTYLPMNTAKKLIGMMSHPLNRPVIDLEKKIVSGGYGLIQPRVDVSVEGANQSFLTKVFAGQAGIDPYSTASSEVYQDLFGEGIFTGKGIYDLEVFNQILGEAIPENSILSHDLLEGSHLRTGLATDLYLVDGYPAKYSSYMMRLHRWVRGDWQLVKWLSATVRNKEGNLISNPLSSLSKWKIFDNLRRSLVSISLVLLFILGMSILPGSPLVWLGLGLLTLLFPFILSVADYIKIKYYTAAREGLRGNLAIGTKHTFYMVLLNLVFLPHHAFMMADAIVRTLNRVFITRRNLLEWVTVADSEKKLKNDVQSYIRRMVSIFPIVVVALWVGLFVKPNNLFYGLPILIGWTIAPWVAYYTSLQKEKTVEPLEKEELQELRRIARKTWGYYEDLVGEEDHYLPPDNLQIYPPRGVAHRTSPTNIGFYLMAVLSAKDFGYVTTKEMVERIKDTMNTLGRIETWKGHLYNWYDTRNLEVLRPRYISTVDSGNFVAYLITLKEGLKEALSKSLIDKSLVEGIKDTLQIIKGEDEEEYPQLVLIDELIERDKITLKEYIDLLDAFERGEWPLKSDEEGRLESHIRGCREELNTYFPWLKSLVERQELMAAIESRGNIRSVLEEIKKIPSIMELRELYKLLIKEIDTALKGISKEERVLLTSLREEVMVGKENLEDFINAITTLVFEIEAMAEKTEFIHLYDKKRNLFSIGYQVDEERLTNSYYDLLASEVRTTSYLAIARREVPQKHWFKLGRALSIINGHRGLVSWTGTMFEYLMPYLTMKNYENTLMDETIKTVVKAQKRHGNKLNIPWGISESGYYAFDTALNYQYKAFGVPDLGLKRGLIDEIVVSPYSTLLALPIDPKGVIDNVKRLVHEGVEGKYGFYEAIDYTSERLPISENKQVVKSFMAHHLGMSLVSLNNYFHNNIIQERFHRDPVMKSGELLLQERIPLRVIVTKEYKERLEEVKGLETPLEQVVRKYGVPETLPPKCHVLSNGTYGILLTDGGNGYSRKDDIQITRWREDMMAEGYGTYLFIHNTGDGGTWSATYEPLKKAPDGYQVIFTQDKATYIRNDNNIETKTEVFVSPEDQVEIRRVTLTNHNIEAVNLQVTSYFETVMTNQSSDVAHPAFSNLFVRTEFLTEYDALLASRRPRGHDQTTQWIFHSLMVEGQTVGGIQYETNRGNFIGRGKTIANPVALDHPLKNTTGIAIDPIMSLRRGVRVPEGGTVVITYTTGIEESKEAVVELVKKYHEDNIIERAMDLALTRSQVENTFFNFKAKEIKVFQEMLSFMLFINPIKRRYAEILKENQKGQSALWAYGISGDLPILLISIKRLEDAELVKEALRAHEYWRTKGIKTDLVILNEDESNYLQPLQQLLREMIFSSPSRFLENQPGGIFLRDANVMPPEDIVLLYTVARMILKGEEGPLRKQVRQSFDIAQLPNEKTFTNPKERYISKEIPMELEFFNGYGGFSKDGKEYVIKLREENQTPAPWTNVVANKNFGFIVTESGAGFTWAENSRENKITPWSNDPVSDRPGEVIYLRDEDTGEVWNITPLPKRQNNHYLIRHGLGYSVFQNNSQGLEQELTMFVPEEDPVKISLLSLKNPSTTKRRLSITYYITPVMGVSDEMTRHYLATEESKDTGGLMVRNPYQSDFPNRITFVDSSEGITSFTGDRREFIGLKGSLAEPEALKREKLSNTIGAALDPCIALQCTVDLEANSQKELTFLLGQEQEKSHIRKLVKKYKNLKNAKSALEEVKNYWSGLFETIQVKTPDKSMDFMLNAWLLYQTISCRLWARSAFYQSGGAYGYRDQLQDAMNMLHPYPEAVRRQIIIHCQHQFVEGDVQHWWHPGAGEKGIRTRFSDDLLWLPYATAEYFNHTKDESILREITHFLEEEPLREGEDERYGVPRISEEKSTVYDHCIRAIERALKYGVNGIPLMGSGDWNDGMSTVGNKGKGESVWLGWFIHRILKKFSEICYLMEDKERGDRYIKIADEIESNIDQNAWDGDWYIRAFYDDGSPLGSSQNTECIIDSLAQSWSIIARDEEHPRSRIAMRSVEDYLIKKEEGLILLFTPPFDDSDQEPGYIKGYVPGVRENGGQYTHAASWVIKGFAQLKEGDKAWELYNMINPINHTRTQLECAVYKVEPYVMAADVYAVAPHVGRGGWTWYTGVAGWMYSVGLEDILGIKRRGNQLIIDPCIPKDWKEFEIKYRFGNTLYHIFVTNNDGVNYGVKSLKLDEELQENATIQLSEDGKEHRVEVAMGQK
ncbi:GH36-type glycosyl hydrolase domain-containing protein [Alkaliphilus transvaalensis]|uniref:GH36-type glycosyl hydrolase domain-containing protein n=1 Tax=Alkaliphilus transvaalensis TaxID=114628 RepID=UPI0006867992|nr:glucoamylase family protein [Alkaliphilus transvaalensis]